MRWFKGERALWEGRGCEGTGRTFGVDAIGQLSPYVTQTSCCFNCACRLQKTTGKMSCCAVECTSCFILFNTDHICTVWNIVIIIILYIAYAIGNAYTHALAYRWQLTMQSIREKLERVNKSSQCFGKSCILEEFCLCWYLWALLSAVVVMFKAYNKSVPLSSVCVSVCVCSRDSTRQRA